MLNHLIHPKNFTLQWHITERCNWKCKHCYQDEDYIKEELSFEQLVETLDQFIFLLKEWNIPKRSARLNITGGEPFVRKDFYKLLNEVFKRSHYFTWGLLSNGSFITKEAAKKLKLYGINRYQVSLEGLEKYNDEIRGKGTFKQALKAIKILKDEGIPTNVSLTLTKTNCRQIYELSNVLLNAGARSIGTRRLIPIGIGSQLKNELLEPIELKNYYLKTLEINKDFVKERKNFRIIIGCESGIFNDEIPNQRRYHNCGVYEGRVLIVMPNGDVLPCRRLPIVVGNVMKQKLFEIYYSANMLWQLRNLNNSHHFCKKCNNFNKCFGGALCVTYAYFKKLHVPDVQCWKYYNKLEKSDFYDKKNIKLSKILWLKNLIKT